MPALLDMAIPKNAFSFMCQGHERIRLYEDIRPHAFTGHLTFEIIMDGIILHTALGKRRGFYSYEVRKHDT